MVCTKSRFNDTIDRKAYYLNIKTDITPKYIATGIRIFRVKKDYSYNAISMQDSHKFPLLLHLIQYDVCNASQLIKFVKRHVPIFKRTRIYSL